VVFHISPSNVPINFAYSLVAGLLSGNANIVRLSSKAFEQVDILCEIINKIDHEISNYIVLLQYPHNKQITDYFSFLADTRIIWGGDETIENIRTSPLKPRANEITFADRNSMCIINSDEYLKHRNKDSLAVGFYNDTYLFDQNACTASKIIIWEGKGIEKARSIFNAHLHNVVLEKYKQSPIQSVQKYLKFTYFATQFDHCTLEKKDNLLYFIRIGELTSSLDKYFSNSGFFFEYIIKKDFDELIPLFSEKMQTISYFGVDIELLKKSIYEHHVRGVDRILPIGQTLDFNLVWDGFDLISSMSRSITII